MWRFPGSVLEPLEIGLLRMSCSGSSRFVSIVVVSLLWGGAAGSSVSVAMADAYLDALQEAADGVQVDPLSTSEQQDTGSGIEPERKVTVVPAAVKGDIPSGLDLAGLADFLKQGYVGSYAFFKRLSDEQKQKVFAAYLARPEIAYIRSQIKQQYLQP